jgi:hypothetical protein
MQHGDMISGEIPTPRACELAYGAPADHERTRCGAMILQDCGHGVQSWPQQFIRLVGGHCRPMPLQAAPQNSAFTG